MNRISTEQGNIIDLSCPLSEHPNPQFRREKYVSLNGRWAFCMNQSLDISCNYEQTIIVPFAVETALSGIEKEVSKEDVLHYRRLFDLPSTFNAFRVVLHFEAVDQICDVYLNGEHLGRHEGGYLPFSFKCPRLKAKDNVLDLVIVDDTSSGVFPHGKQSTHPGGIWYHPTSGVWGSVWLEEVSKDHIEEIRYEYDIQGGICKVFIKLTDYSKIAKVECFFHDKLLLSIEADNLGVAILELGENARLWTPDEPNLYQIKVTYEEDIVHSYFGMREISVTDYKGHLYPELNGKPIFLSGPLDQGYFPESGLTPPSDQALINDISVIKSFGFNCVRKHIKMESRRYYAHCDELGLLVIQDFINVGAYSKFYMYTAPFIAWKLDDSKEKIQQRLGIKEEASKNAFLMHAEAMIELLHDHPSIICWTIFNEGWGQFETKNVFLRIKALDPSRLIDANSGWFDQGVGDFCSKHIYFRKVRLKKASGRILSLSEFGGYSLKVPGHVQYEKEFGYKKMKSPEMLTQKLVALYEKEIIPAKKQGLAVAIYTQLSDVEQEINGLMTFDRKVWKVKPEVLRRINAKLLEL